MSQKVKSHLKNLQLLSCCKNKKRIKIIETCDGSLIEAIGECIRNVLKKVVPLSKPQFHKLKKHKRHLRILGNKKTALKVKRKLLKQHGGFLPALLGPVVSFLAGLFGKTVSASI